MTVRVGFLGAGLIAGFHASSLKHSGADVALVAAYDPDAERAKTFAETHSLTAMTSEAAVIDAADAVYVCTWTSEHPRQVSAVVEAGRSVFCEKPLATSLDQAVAMAAEVARSGTINQVGLVLRSSPAFAFMKQKVAEPENGRVMSATFRDDQAIPIGGFYDSDWRGDVERAGAGTLLEHSIHDLDILEWILGPVTAVSAVSSGFHEIPGIEDSVAATMRLAGGGVATISSIWHDLEGRMGQPRRFEVFCENARIEFEGNIDGVVRWESNSGSGEISGDDLIDELGIGSRANADAAFISAVANGHPASPDFATAVRAHQVADAIYRSAAANGTSVAVE